MSRPVRSSSLPRSSSYLSISSAVSDDMHHRVASAINRPLPAAGLRPLTAASLARRQREREAIDRAHAMQQVITDRSVVRALQQAVSGATSAGVVSVSDSHNDNDDDNDVVASHSSSSSSSSSSAVDSTVPEAREESQRVHWHDVGRESNDDDENADHQADLATEAVMNVSKMLSPPRHSPSSAASSVFQSATLTPDDDNSDAPVYARGDYTTPMRFDSSSSPRSRSKSSRSRTMSRLAPHQEERDQFADARSDEQERKSTRRQDKKETKYRERDRHHFIDGEQDSSSASELDTDVEIEDEEDDSETHLTSYVLWLHKCDEVAPYASDPRPYEGGWLGSRYDLHSEYGRHQEYWRRAFVMKCRIDLFGSVMYNYYHAECAKHNKPIDDKRGRAPPMSSLSVPVFYFDARDRLYVAESGYDQDLPYRSHTLAGLHPALSSPLPQSDRRAFSNIQTMCELYFNQWDRHDRAVMAAKGHRIKKEEDKISQQVRDQRPHTRRRSETPRVLPPSGRIWSALWVLGEPEGPYTRMCYGAIPFGKVQEVPETVIGDFATNGPVLERLLTQRSLV